MENKEEKINDIKVHICILELKREGFNNAISKINREIDELNERVYEIEIL